MDKIKGIAFAFISSAAFGLIPLFSIPLLTAGLHTSSILFYRSLLSAFFLLGICVFRKKRLLFSAPIMIQLVIMSFFYVLTASGLIYSYAYISSGIATTIHFLYPIVVASIMILFYKEKLSLQLFFAALLSLIGVAFLSWSSSGFINIKGFLSVFITVFTYAFYIVNLNKPSIKKLDSEVISFYVMLFASFVFLPISYFTTGFELISDAASCVNIVALSLFASVSPLLLLSLAVRYVGPTVTSILGSMEPLVATLVGICYFHESIGWNGLLGLSFVVGGVIITITRKSKQASA